MSWGQIVILDSELCGKVFEFKLSNCFPLSDTNAFGILNLHIMECQAKLHTFCSVIVANGLTSVQLVK